MPGLVNSHGHAAMSLLRGYADDQPLMPWLEQHIWPAEGGSRQRRDLCATGQAGYRRDDPLRHHDFQRHVFFPDACAETAQRLGMRCQIVFPCWIFATVWRAAPTNHISRGLALRDDVKHSALVTVGSAPCQLHGVRTQPGAGGDPRRRAGRRCRFTCTRPGRGVAGG